jgi:hypothetical protein
LISSRKCLNPLFHNSIIPLFQFLFSSGQLVVIFLKSRIKRTSS